MTEEERRAIARARERADLARMRFGNALDHTVQRITPERLRADALGAAGDHFHKARREFLAHFGIWPAALGGLALAALVTILWHPIRKASHFGLRAASFAWATRHLWRRKS